jgi:hypothetical protein
MRVLVLMLAVLVCGCSARAAVPGGQDKEYWVPLIAPDGLVHEIQIIATDSADARVIVCLPISPDTFRCLARRFSDGAYKFVTIQLEQPT